MSSVKLNTTGGSGGSVALKGPASTTSNADVELTLPVDDGSADQYLKTDGSGALSWSTVSTTDSSKVAKTGDTMTGELTIDTTATASTVCQTLKAPQNERLNVWKNNDNGNGSWYAGGDASNVMDLQWNSYSAQVIKFKNAGDVEVLTGNLKISTAGKGIDFSAVSHSGGMTSELLDSYEEGTWTPTCVSNGGANPNCTYGTRFGTYTKVGNVVYYSFFFSDVDITYKGAGNAAVGGFPFTAKTESTFGYIATVGHVTPNKFSSDTVTGLFMREGESIASLMVNTGSQVTYSTNTDNFAFGASGFYFV